MFAPAAQAQVECSTAETDGSYLVPSDWALKPSGLAAGSKFRLLFVTSTPRNARASIATFNTFVQDRAKAGHSAITDSCGNLFKVVGSTNAVDARSNTRTRSSDTDAAIYWLTGAKAADNYADFWDGNWDSYAGKTESGANNSRTDIWTGSNTDGTKHSSQHLNRGSGGNVIHGNLASGQNPINGGSAGRQVTKPFYGISPVFTVAPTFSISGGSSVALTEDAGTVTFTVTKTGAGAAMVDYCFQHLTTNAADFNPAPSPLCGGTDATLTFASADTTKTVTVTVDDDDVPEENELFQVAIRNPSGATLGSTTSQELIILDNDRAIVLSSGSLTVPEGGSRTYTVKLNFGFAAGTETVTIGGTSGTDVTVQPGTLTFTSTNWNAPQTVTVTAAEDEDDTPDSVTLTHSIAPNNHDYATPSLAVTVRDNEVTGHCGAPTPVPEGTEPPVDLDLAVVFDFSQDSFRAWGGEEVTITVVRTGTRAASVGYATGDGTLKAPGGYTHTTGRLTFASGETERSFTVPVGGTAGTFRVLLKDPSDGAAVCTDTWGNSVRVVPQQPKGISFGQAPKNVREGGPSKSYQVWLDRAPAGGDVTVTVTSDNPDVTVSPSTLTFNASNWSHADHPRQRVTITAGQDSDSHWDGATLTHTATGGGYGGFAEEVFVEVNDDDTGKTPLIELTETAIAASEGGGFYVKVRKVGTGAATVQYATADGTASAGSDYKAASGTLRFGSEKRLQAVLIQTRRDSDAAEGPETFTFTLSNPSGATLSSTKNEATVTIADGPALPVIQFSPGTYTGVEANGSVTVTVTKTDAGAASVDYATSDGTATAPGDYTATSGTLTFASGDTQKTFTVPVIADGEAESTEYFDITLTNPVGATLGSPIIATVTILSNSNQYIPPPVTVTLSADATSVTEGGDVTFTVTASPAPAADLPVTVSVDEEMGSGNDRVGGTLLVPALTIKAGETSASYTVTAMDDNVQRADGTMTGSIVAGEGYTAGTPSTVTLDLLDDDAPDSAQGLGQGDSVVPQTPAIDPVLVADVRARAAETQHGTAHVNRWKRVLVAFGLESYPGLEPMTAAEAEANAKKYSTPLWPEIAKVLAKLEGAPDTPDMPDTPVVPVVTVSAGADVTEGGDAVFTLTASPAPAAALPVSVTVAADGDWGVSAGSRTVTFNAGASTATLTLATTDDNADEADGSVTATVAGGTGYTVGAASSGTVAVADNDAAPVVADPVVTISAEGDVTEGGTAIFALAASPAPAAPLAVDVTVATDGDWGVSAGSVTATVGTNGHGHLRLVTANDDADEPDGSITATLEDGAGYTAGDPASGTVAVQDNDLPLPVVTLAAGDAVTEGGDAVFTLTADRAPDANLTVRVTVSEAGGGDRVGADNEGARGVTILKGETTATLAVPTADDALDEPDGSVTATLEDGAGYAVGDPASGRVAVTDDDLPVVTVTAGNAVTEGGDAVFTLSASPAPSADLAVRVTVATDGDWGVTAGSRTVTIDTTGSGTLTLATTDDGADEPDGAVTATVESGSGYAVGTASSASVRVADDDAAPVTVLPALSVDDVTVREGEEWLMVFTVRLSAPSAQAVEVRADTRDVTAQAPQDYSLVENRRLTFDPGDTEKQVRVIAYEDSHDEGTETFELVLSEARGATLADGVGVGAITNDDPLPAAYLARFGRAVAGQALDGITGRMNAVRAPGLEAALAGRAWRRPPAHARQGEGRPDAARADGAAHDGEAQDGRSPYGTGRGQTGLSSPGGHSTGLHGMELHNNGAGLTVFEGAGPGASTGVLSARDLLDGSRFALTREADASGGTLAFWGHTAHARFDGTDTGNGAPVRLDGTVLTGVLGADYARGRWLTGLALTWSEANGDYTALRDTGYGGVPGAMTDAGHPGATGQTPAPGPGACLTPAAGTAPGGTGPADPRCADTAGDGALDATLLAAIPYASWQATERLSLWGAAGYGVGEVTVRTGADGRYRADTTWTLAAAGLRGELLSAPVTGGPALAVTADTLWTRTDSDKAPGLAASSSDVTRARIGLTGSWRLGLDHGGELTPRLELGARYDGGDAETGAGIEVGGGLLWQAPQLGLRLDLAGRTLLTHEDKGMTDTGFSAALTLDPDPLSLWGPSFTLEQTLGGQADGGLDALFAHDPLPTRSAGQANARWQAEAVYGVPVLGGRFAGSPHVSLARQADTQDWHMGWRLAPAGNNAPDLSFAVRATRRESSHADPDHQLGLELRSSW